MESVAHSACKIRISHFLSRGGHTTPAIIVTEELEHATLDLFLVPISERTLQVRTCWIKGPFDRGGVRPNHGETVVGGIFLYDCLLVFHRVLLEVRRGHQVLSSGYDGSGSIAQSSDAPLSYRKNRNQFTKRANSSTLIAKLV